MYESVVLYRRVMNAGKSKRDIGNVMRLCDLRKCVPMHKPYVKDQLFPSKSSYGTTYDIDLVHSLVHKFVMHVGSSLLKVVETDTSKKMIMSRVLLHQIDPIVSI